MISRKYHVLPLLLLTILVIFPSDAFGQDQNPKHEFRAAWVASVTNLDWPIRGADPESQQQHLIDILDGLKEAGMNAVFFQVRPETDALYQSDIEPWSYWLTGEQGTAPDPFYDPLEFAIEEAHKRGMELHAWFNPYRAERAVGNYTLAENHVVRQHPEWILDFGSLKILDPGQQEVRDYVTSVVMDVVRRYDVDGIHFDDYFYPYSPIVSDEDAATFEAEPRGFTNIGDWRRDNVNIFIAQVNDSIQVVDPDVKYGVSPFGIWKNNVPAGIFGLDAYNVIYADAVAWLEAQSVDYIVPQLYWGFGGGQDYARLAPWWATQLNGRHYYPGLGAYKADRATFANALYGADVVPRQIRFNREHEQIHGSVIFRSSNITRYATQGLADSLAQNLFARPALTPPMPWKDMSAPPAPANLGFHWSEDDTTVVNLTWDAATDVDRYAIYRVYADDAPLLDEVVSRGDHLIGLTGDTEFRDRPAQATAHYFVTSVSANSIESEAEVTISLEGRATSAQREMPVAFELHQNYPNPFNPSTSIRYSVREAGPVSLVVYDAMGREIAVLADEHVPPGTHTVEFDGADVASGMYLYVLESDGHRQARSMVLLK